ncbi:alpha-amylase, partial [bacterium]
MFQAFQWYSKDDGTLWRDLGGRAKELKDAGITAVWIPPAYKGSGGAKDVGYAVYDLFDLGEFDQKGSVRTKYGTRAELHDSIKAMQGAGLQVYADVVLNHRVGADGTEDVEAVEVDKNNRTAQVSPPYTIKAWTKFDFPGRGEKYSSFHWNSTCFSSVDSNANAPDEDKLFLL